ncbi:hypothetical protein SK128_010974 [Halocaridina rubra]|uniref:Fibronectin type-III domain-containing protein n=1 Tax=Halocaridina rubra TaxID=373956 RepID=A0AAN8X5V0_HALRR
MRTYIRKPDSVTSCSVFNETEKSVSVSCEPGYSGGVDQSFLIEAWDEGVIKATDTSDTPVMEVTGLRAGTRYTLKVFAVNSMGRSQPYIFTTFTLTDVAERRTALGDVKHGEPLSPIIGSIIGGVAALLLLLLIALLIAKCKMQNNREGHSLRETSSGGEVGYKSCEKAEERTDSGLTTTSDTQTQQRDLGPDLLSASQESSQMIQSHDSTTPLIGNGRVLQGQGKPESQYQKQQQQQQQYNTQPYLQHQFRPQPTQPQHTQQSYVDPHQSILGIEQNPRSPESSCYQDQVLLEGVGTPYQRHNITYVPVYDYQKHPQQQGEREWPAGESIWGGMSVSSPLGICSSPTGGTDSSPSGMPGGMHGGVPRGGQGHVSSPSSATPTCSSPSAYGTVDPRRHSAYLRPMDQIPSQIIGSSQITSRGIPPHLSTGDYKPSKVQFAPSGAASGAAAHLHPPAPTTTSATPTTYQHHTSEHESAV